MRYRSGRLDTTVSRSPGHHQFDAPAVLGAVDALRVTSARTSMRSSGFDTAFRGALGH